MIAVDSSALMAIALAEPDAARCVGALYADPHVLISAATLAEALIAASGRNVGAEMHRLLTETSLQIVPVTEAAARRVAAAYAKWGRGFHPARLNYGDCFSYEIAKHHDCALLFIGNDFSRTDLVSVL